MTAAAHPDSDAEIRKVVTVLPKDLPSDDAQRIAVVISAAQTDNGRGR